MEHHLLSSMREAGLAVTARVHRYAPRRRSSAVDRQRSGFQPARSARRRRALGTLAAMAIMVSPAFLRHARADAGIAQAMDVCGWRAKRRSVSGATSGLSGRADAIQTMRRGHRRQRRRDGNDGAADGRVRERMQFRLGAGVPDTPGRCFAMDATRGAIAFGRPDADVHERRHVRRISRATSERHVLPGIPGDPLSARAITIFGPTALIRAWRWNGREWVE